MIVQPLRGQPSTPCLNFSPIPFPAAFQVDDLALKQMALERVVRACDVNESRCEMAVWRLQDADNQARKMAADNQQLRWEKVWGSDVLQRTGSLRYL